MLTASITGLDHVLGNLGKLYKGAQDAMRNACVKGSIALRAMLVKKMSAEGGWDEFWGKTSPFGDVLGVRTGHTRRQISPGGIAIHTARGWTAAVGSPDEHVQHFEEGGEIHGNPMLAIPTAAAQRSGSGTFQFAGQQWRSIPGVFIWPNRRQREGALAGKQTWLARANDGALQLMALLKPSVRQRGRHIFADTQREIQPVFAQLAVNETEIVTRAANE